MRAFKLIRAIARFALVIEARPRGADEQPIDPSLLPLDLAAQGPGGLRPA